MNSLVTVIIPYADYHASIVGQAIAAAQSQTLPCAVLAIEDSDGRGAGWARNTGVALSDTPFVAFLDADDTLREDAIERMVASYQQGKYVYCDDLQGDSLHQTSDLGYYDGTWWHSVTALVPRAAFDFIDGFNEDLPAMEDLEFFLRLQAHGCCGVRCPHPLMRYTAGGQRSLSFKQNPSYVATREHIFNTWLWRTQFMCNCGEPVRGIVPDGKQDGDILVQALYTPMQRPGPVTGRLYPAPRGVNNYQIFVDPRDAAVKPDWWAEIHSINPDALPKVDDVVRMAQEAMRR